MEKIFGIEKHAGKVRKEWFLFFVDNETQDYSHLLNKRWGWNKRRGGAKVAKSLNVEVGINREGGIFLEKTSKYKL